MHERPFYVREHSKRILRGALLHDTRFLADINVMDYSLVVGVDSIRNELVVGIVGACRLRPSIRRRLLTSRTVQTISEHILGTRS